MIKSIKRLEGNYINFCFSDNNVWKIIAQNVISGYISVLYL